MWYLCNAAECILLNVYDTLYFLVKYGVAHVEQGLLPTSPLFTRCSELDAWLD